MKRSVFKNRGLPYLLVLPQLAVTVVFFFWPAVESLRLSFFRTSAFGDKVTFVGLDNFTKLLSSPDDLVIDIRNILRVHYPIVTFPQVAGD